MHAPYLPTSPHLPYLQSRMTKSWQLGSSHAQAAAQRWVAHTISHRNKILLLLLLQQNKPGFVAVSEILFQVNKYHVVRLNDFCEIIFIFNALFIPYI